MIRCFQVPFLVKRDGIVEACWNDLPEAADYISFGKKIYNFPTDLTWAVTMKEMTLFRDPDLFDRFFFQEGDLTQSDYFPLSLLFASSSSTTAPTTIDLKDWTNIVNIHPPFFPVFSMTLCMSKDKARFFKKDERIGEMLFEITFFPQSMKFSDVIPFRLSLESTHSDSWAVTHFCSFYSKLLRSGLRDRKLRLVWKKTNTNQILSTKTFLERRKATIAPMKTFPFLTDHYLRTYIDSFAYSEPERPLWICVGEHFQAEDFELVSMDIQIETGPQSNQFDSSPDQVIKKTKTLDGLFGRRATVFLNR